MVEKRVNIPVKVQLKDFFRVYIDVINPIYKLKKREKEVLEAFLKIYYSNRGMGSDRINTLLFSKEVKKRIRSAIKMSEPSFNNHLVQLRKKRVLKGDTLSQSIIAHLPEESLDISYSIVITL